MPQISAFKGTIQITFMCSLGSIMFDVSKKKLLLFFSHKVSIKNCGGGQLFFFIGNTNSKLAHDHLMTVSTTS
jgi:hypothetical protein